MIPVPQTRRSGLNTIPWFALALLLGYLLVQVTVQRGEQARQQELATWYQNSGLFALEWENYISWLRISGQINKAEKLEQVRASGDQLALFHAMAFDPAFERENIVRGTQYWSEAEFNRWRQGREQFKQQAAQLPSVRWGLNPAAPRPATYVSWHFLNDSLLPVLLTALVLLPLAWAVEGTLGTLRALAATLLGGILIALVYVMLFGRSYIPVTGSTPIATLWAGMLLGLFRLNLVPCRFWHPTRKTVVERSLPGWLFATPALLLVLYELIGGNAVPWMGLLHLVAALVGFALVLLLEPKTLITTAPTEAGEPDAQPETTNDQDTLYRQTLTQGWAAMGTLSFRDAEREFRKAHALAPEQLNPVSGLFQITRIALDSPAFAEVCEKLWRVEPADSGEVKQWSLLLREQARLTQEQPLEPSDEARAHLVRTLAQHGEALEADKYAQAWLQAESLSDCVSATLQQLAAAHAQAGNDNRAAHWRQLLLSAGKAPT